MQKTRTPHQLALRAVFTPLSVFTYTMLLFSTVLDTISAFEGKVAFQMVCAPLGCLLLLAAIGLRSYFKVRERWEKAAAE